MTGSSPQARTASSCRRSAGTWAWCSSPTRSGRTSPCSRTWPSRSSSAAARRGGTSKSACTRPSRWWDWAAWRAARLEQVGTPSEVYERPATPFVRDFLGRALTLSGIVRRDGSAGRLDLLDAEGVALVFRNGTPDRYPDETRLAVSCRPEDLRLE